MTLKDQATAGLKWQAIELIGRQALSFVVFTALSRILAPSEFGLFGMVGVYLAFIGLFASQGIRAALVQRKDLQQDHIDTAFWFSIVSAIGLCLGTIIFAAPVASWFNEPLLAPYLRWASVVLVVTAASTIHNTLFARTMDFRRPAIRVLIANLAGGLIGLTMAFGGYGVWALVGQQLASAIASATFLWIASPYRPSMRFSKLRLRELRGISSPIFATSLLTFFASRLDAIIVSHYAGATVFGIYIIAGKLPEMVRLIAVQPVLQIATPAMSRLQTSLAAMRHAVYQASELNALVSFAVFGGLAAIASDLVPLLFGSQWIDSSLLCSLFALYSLATALQVFLYPCLLAVGAMRDHVQFNLVQAAGVLIVCLTGIQFHVKYVVLGMLLNSIIGCIIAHLLLKKRLGLSPNRCYRTYILPAAASLAMVGTIWGTSLVVDSLPVWFRLVLKLLTGSLTYMGIIYFVNPKLLNKLFGLVLQALGRSVRPRQAKLSPI